MHAHRLLAVLALGLSALAVTQCGSVSPDSTSPSRVSTPPSPAPAPPPAPSPAPAPSPGPASPGGSLSVSPPTVQGQGQPTGTVTLASAAPDGGALVVLKSDDPTIARVPASVTVAPGSRSASFLIETSTVRVPFTVKITATYGDASMTTTVTVTPPPLIPSFVVRSRSRGPGNCVADEQSQELDCVFDASGSQGFIETYLWTYTVGATTVRQTSPKTNAIVSPQGTGCPLYQQGTGGEGPFLRMEVTLQVRDALGVVSGVLHQQVRLYPNRQCGFSY